MKRSTEKSVFLLVAMGLTLMAANFDVACCGTTFADHDSNDPPVTAIHDDFNPGHDSSHEDGHCCESCCHACSLPCCAGSVMISTTAQPVDPALQWDGRLTATTIEVSWIDPDPLFHPPRA